MPTVSSLSVDGPAGSGRPFFTVGHSTRPIDEFVHLLRTAGVEHVADIRRLPGSAAHPQFNGPELDDALAESGIAYAHVPELGGRRPRDHSVPDEVNAFWSNRSFHNYADYALGEQFRAGLDGIVGLGAQTRVAVMCSEAVWWRCHRRIVADHLLAHGHEVFHLMGDHRAEPAHLTDAVRIMPDGMLTYPAIRSGSAEHSR
jgi:uncharacterized protein (DUF488 family)